MWDGAEQTPEGPDRGQLQSRGRSWRELHLGSEGKQEGVCVSLGIHIHPHQQIPWVATVVRPVSPPWDYCGQACVPPLGTTGVTTPSLPWVATVVRPVSPPWD